MLDKIALVRQKYLKSQHDLEFYPYQVQISDQILSALLQNFRITSNATEEDIRRLKQIEIPIEISRQGGKTYAVGHTAAFAMEVFPEMFDRQLRIGIFSPQLNQASISYKILRNSLRKAKARMMITPDQQKLIAQEENARELVLPDGSLVVVAPISKISLIEGRTFDLIIIDEAQEADDSIVQHSIWPMGKTTNAPRIYIGKAGTKITHYYRMSQNNNTLKFYFDEVVKQRRELYNQNHDARHLIYEQSVREDIVKYGEDSDFIQREYFGKWQIGTGQFTTADELDALVDVDEDGKIRAQTFTHKKMPCFAGIDTAKHPDSTVVTIIRWNEKLRKKQLLNWMELHGENYQDQFDQIQFFLSNYNIQAIAIDSTGQGDFMPDMFEAHTEWRDENSGLYRIKFSAVSKDNMYKNLKVSIQQLLTTLPNLGTKQGEKFRQQMLDLQQEHKGQLLSVHHPDDANAHDDYPDSWALAEWAYARWDEDNDVEIVVMSSRPERKVKKRAGKVTDYWPGMD